MHHDVIVVLFERNTGRVVMHVCHGTDVNTNNNNERREDKINVLNRIIIIITTKGATSNNKGTIGRIVR